MVEPNPEEATQDRIRSLRVVQNQVGGSNYSFEDTESGYHCKCASGKELAWYRQILRQDDASRDLSVFRPIVPEVKEMFRLRMDVDQIDLSQVGVSQVEMDQMVMQIKQEMTTCSASEELIIKKKSEKD